MENNGYIPENLEKAGKKLPFRVPEDYFENFPGRLRDRLNLEQQSLADGRLFAFVKPYLSLAALIAGIALVAWFGYHQFNVNSRNNTFNSYELSTIVDYYLHDYDEDLLISTLIESGEETNLSPLEDYSDEIMDYLTVDGIDYSLLIDDNKYRY
jgi:hypothetical protein